MRRRGISKAFLYPAIFMLAVVALVGVRMVAVKWQAPKPVASTQPSTAPASQPATAPATTQAAPEGPLVDLLDLIRADHPDYPTTQPLDLPSDLEDAARLVVDRPVYLDSLGYLWITHPRGQSIDELLRKPIKKRTLIVNEEVAYVWWRDDGRPLVIVRKGRDVYETYGHARMRYEVGWIDPGVAIPLGDRLFVPQLDGFTSLNISSVATEQSRLIHLPARGGGPIKTPVVAARCDDGLLAWAPWENGESGSTGALFIRPDASTIPLDRSTGWVDQPIQLVPLADGSVLAIGKTETGIELVLKPLTEAPPPSTELLVKLAGLARKLADRDPLVREDTQRQLEAMGPSIYPELEKMKDDLAVESQVRIEAILGQRFAPTLGGLRPLDGQPLTIARLRDGGCVLMLTGGGTYEEDGQTKSYIPAFISIRPGHYVERIDPSKVANFAPGKHKLAAFGSEWVVFDPTLGPQRWIGNKLYPLAGSDFKSFDDFVGIDAQRRWIFKSTTQPGKTLILDTTLPDLEPRLPVWAIDAPDGAGWTSAGWPAVKREKNIFVLGERGWRMLDKDEKFESTPPNVVPSSATSAAGDRFDVVGETITTKPKNGATTTLLVPPEARGVGPDQLFWAADHLFLFTGPGKLHRFAWREGKLSFERTFEENLTTRDVKRVWLDPVGRLCIANDTGVWITFPTGRVPGAISQLMLQGR